MTEDTLASREMLYRAFGHVPRLVAAFEDAFRKVEETAQVVGAGTQATEAIQDATVIVLSANGAFTNERVLECGPGLVWEDKGDRVLIRIADDGVTTSGGFAVNLSSQGVTNVLLPIAGTLATVAEAETLKNKAFDRPLIVNLGNYANDAAAASAGVVVGGVYRNGSVLMVRVA